MRLNAVLRDRMNCSRILEDRAAEGAARIQEVGNFELDIGEAW